MDRAARNLIARAVKIADLRDNLDIGRFADPEHSDEQRAQEYIEGVRSLGI